MLQQKSLLTKQPTIPVKDKDLLQKALTHRSWLNENENSVRESNERLEFLGDAVLELVITEYLYKKFPKEQEGKLTALRASLVRTETLAKIAKKLDLGKAIYLSNGEEMGGGRENESLLADTFEAIVGAIYCESGKTATTKFIHQYLTPELPEIIKNHLEKDAKSLLQEKVQALGKHTPDYRVLEEKGPDHDKLFTVSVLIDGKPLATGEGKSKQQAQQQAASTALEKL